MAETLAPTNPQEGVAWHRVPNKGGWINALHIQPDMEHRDQFILTMDGPRGGEYGRIKVSRMQLLEMIVAADKERDRVRISRQ